MKTFFVRGLVGLLVGASVISAGAATMKIVRVNQGAGLAPVVALANTNDQQANASTSISDEAPRDTSADASASSAPIAPTLPASSTIVPTPEPSAPTSQPTISTPSREREWREQETNDRFELDDD